MPRKKICRNCLFSLWEVGWCWEVRKEKSHRHSEKQTGRSVRVEKSWEGRGNHWWEAREWVRTRCQEMIIQLIRELGTRNVKQKDREQKRQEDPELKTKLSSSPNTPATHFPSACLLSPLHHQGSTTLLLEGTNKNTTALRLILKEQQNKNEEK